MKKKVFALLLCGLPLMINAQDAFDVLHLSQTELRGTSRFQSMAGAFGALGGDLSTLTQNPAGIGVYRNSDLGITFSLDFNTTKAGTKPGVITTTNETKFNVNNVGYVGVIRLDSESVPNLNFGFTYNRLHSFNRHYKGGVADIPYSMSNFIADEFINMGGFTDDDLYWSDDFNPYINGDAPRVAVTMYDMPTSTGGRVGIINNVALPNSQGNYAFDDDGYSIYGEQVMGLYGAGTAGYANYEVNEQGHADEYNIAFGGNIANKVYFGLDFGILDLNYKSVQDYEESLTNAYVKPNDVDMLYNDIINNGTRANWGVRNILYTDGTGVNFKMGLIWKPTQALRIGAAFHTPTYYDMHDAVMVKTYLDAYQDNSMLYTANKESNEGRFTYTIKTPWRFIGSLAGVIGTNGIISMDYEYVANETMRVGEDRGNDWPEITYNIKNCFKPSHIIRLGGEYRANPNWSLRAGYSYKTEQVKKGIDNYTFEGIDPLYEEGGESTYVISTVGDNPAYQYDNSVQNITCGVGYRYKSFYADVAYVHTIRNSVYNAFSNVLVYDNRGGLVFESPNVGTDVSDHNNRLSLTMGVRF